MEPSTTLGVALRSFHKPILNDYEETITRLYNAGYRTLDFPFLLQDYPNYILKNDDWQKKIESVANLSAKLGIKFTQSHLPYVRDTEISSDPNFKISGYSEYFDECMRRAYIASSMLGVKYATAHPLSFREFNYEEEPNLKGNRDYYDKFVELGIKNNVGTAFENMLPSLMRNLPDRYCTRYEQLIHLIDSYNDNMVAACFDTGHANLMGFNLERALIKLGSRVKNLHINDNHYGYRDEHLQPFMGDIDWYQIMRALVEIDYKGDLTYETNQVGIKAEGELQDLFMKLTYDNGCYLLKIYNSEKEKIANKG